MTQKKADFLLAITSMVWGVAYILMKLGLEGLTPFNLIFLRFVIAFVLTCAIFWKKLTRIDGKTLLYSAVNGLLLFLVLTALLYGLKTTSASSAGFLTGTTVIIVPILQAILTRKFPSPLIVICVLLSLLGIGLLTLGGMDALALDGGSLLCLVGALFYAIYLIATNYFARRCDTLVLGVYQLGFTALLGLLFMLIYETPVLPHSRTGWIAILGLSILCTAFCFVVQTMAQRYTTSEHAGLLFAFGPAFAAVFAYLILGEVLAVQGYIGAFLIFVSVLLANRDGRSAETH